MTESAGFELVGVRHVARSSFLHAERLHMLSPTGAVMERSVVRHPGAVAVVPVDGEEVVFIKQYRAPIDRNLIEIPAGKLDQDGEDPAVAVVRELEEEVGYRAGRIELLTTFWTTPGFSDERMWVYLATELTPVAARPHGAEEEVAEIVRIPLQTIPGMLAAGDFDDAKTIVGLAAALSRIG